MTDNLSPVELLEQYQSYLLGKGKIKKTVKTYLSPVRHLFRYMEKNKTKRINRIDKDIISAFQLYLYDEYDFTLETMRSFLYVLRRFFNYLRENQIISKNPIQKIDPVPKPEPKQIISRYYSLDELISRYLNYKKGQRSYLYLHWVEKQLKGFFRYLRTQEIKGVYSVTQSTLLKYRDYLWQEYERGKDNFLVPRSQIERLRVICRFFRYLHKDGLLKENLGANLGWEVYFKQLQEKAKTTPKPDKPRAALSPLDELKLKYIEYERSKGKSPNTLYGYKKGLEVFFNYLKTKGLSSLAQVEKRCLLEYYPYLYHYKGSRGQPVGMQTKARYLWIVRAFFRFLVRFEYLSKDPAFDLEPIREERGLPRSYLNEKEMFYLLEQPNSSHPLELRDKAIMEVLFSTGMRNNELCQLNLEDIDFQQEMVRVNHPKGGNNHQRVIPIGRVALEYLNDYLTKARAYLENGHPEVLFLSYSGKRINTEAVLNIVKKYAFQCGFRKNITPHSFRVSCATLMLKHKADLRYVQEQLGHKRITSTQVYTRLLPLDLKKIHQKCHPRERKNWQNRKDASRLAKPAAAPCEASRAKRGAPSRRLKPLTQGRDTFRMY